MLFSSREAVCLGLIIKIYYIISLCVGMAQGMSETSETSETYSRTTSLTIINLLLLNARDPGEPSKPPIQKLRRLFWPHNIILGTAMP